jgi:hypothetical protein
MKLLNLVLFSNSHPKEQEGYEEMQKILQKYYTTFSNVKTIFYKYSDEDKFEDNILYIKGVESLVPGVLEKTLKTFEYVINDIDEYDYIVRTNISSIINFKLLEEELIQNPVKFFGGGHIMVLNWTGGGITDSTWYGTLFVPGTCLIFTKEALKFIVQNQQLIHKDIVDDLAIAILFREHKPDIVPQCFKDREQYKATPIFYTDDGFNLIAIKNFVKSNNIIVYRNRCYNCRKIDQIQMRLIVDILLNII